MSAASAVSPAVRPQSVPLYDLSRQRERMAAGIEARVSAVLKHGQFILGPEVAELEGRLAEYCGASHAIGVSSGRDALTMALMAMGVGEGDAVFVPGFTFSASAASIAPLGAVPVFVDVDERSFNLDPAAFEAAIAEVNAAGRLRPAAVMPVDLYGRPADYPAISAIAARHGVAVLADAAQSFGGALGNQQVGAMAPITATSFYPTKPLGAYGDGGAIFTQDDSLAEAVLQIRTHGRQGSGDEALRIGMTGRLDTIQAAVLLEKLDSFAWEIARRREIAAAYDEGLRDLVETPLMDGASSAWALYTIRVPERDRVRDALQAAGVGSGLFYRVPLHRHPAFVNWVPEGLSLPVSERLADEVLSLPIHADLNEDEVAYVIEQVRAAVA
ncbi:DegT/DnrJ/EryC1/StrS family protein [Lutibaculum baratangense AMV1]|uniref:DegT/DnrJ/EryC1/StrS family protein n=1 Tax=Lutibaculum baratangense AMV1 TaxID=631454 RepID=V4R3N3_9HYPH|nr:DegT/DnrJ/EryC1/StrS family protein [Lutibaculum baratangense AMV1]